MREGGGGFRTWAGAEKMSVAPWAQKFDEREIVERDEKTRLALEQKAI